MPGYKVILHLALPEPLRQDSEALGGCYVTRQVHADTSDAAALAANQLLLTEARFQTLAGQFPDGILVSIDNVEELPGPPDPSANTTGYVYYPAQPTPSMLRQALRSRGLWRFLAILTGAILVLWWLDTLL